MKFITFIPLEFTNKEVKPGETFKPKDKEVLKDLLAEGKVRALSDFIGDRYKDLTAWLHDFDLTGDEIKETLPGLYQDIQDAIEAMDKAFVNEDFNGLLQALEKVRKCYREALVNPKTAIQKAIPVKPSPAGYSRD
jgi:hypothetical protein